MKADRRRGRGGQLLSTGDKNLETIAGVTDACVGPAAALAETGSDVLVESDGTPAEAEQSDAAQNQERAKQAEQPKSRPDDDPLARSHADNVPSAIDADNAKLPATYEQAKRALAECESIVECKDWADRTAAIGHYAHIAKDTELARHALRIRALATRRAGELLLEIPPESGGRPPRSKNSGGHSPEFSNDTLKPVTKARSPRAAAIKASGMSPHQAKEAMRVAKIPQKRFQRQVNSSDPPSLTTLAKQGTRTRSAPTVPAADGRSADEVVGEDAVKRAMADMQATHTFDLESREVRAFARIAARLPHAMVRWAADLLAHLRAAAST
jgi:hypothetical protein